MKIFLSCYCQKGWMTLCHFNFSCFYSLVHLDWLIFLNDWMIRIIGQNITFVDKIYCVLYVVLFLSDFFNNWRNFIADLSFKRVKTNSLPPLEKPLQYFIQITFENVYQIFWYDLSGSHCANNWEERQWDEESKIFAKYKHAHF